ncbi:MAG: radical SAM family heme chaperone HemW [Verrucomicrobia bacterium]|nr:radical SAM family heme chaperone HemW [Verrucomicrobiota bacterium]
MSEIKVLPKGASKHVSLGVYVHVPFCAKTCDYCAFYQVSPTVPMLRQYLDGVSAEAGMVEWIRPVDTVFWGGGTPGLLSPGDLRKLGETVKANFGGVPTEWSVEMAPASVTEARLAVLRELGVTRISMGAQSFQPDLLAALGRPHTREQILRAYDRIRAAGFASVNIDMMFALPGQDEAAWLADVREAVSLAPDHISTYCLTFEEDTALWVKLSEGKVKLDPEREAQLYEKTWEELGAAGYAQYEISNFARPGHACLHNLNTWRMHEWIGLGPSAASQYAGWRGTNISDLAAWSEKLGRGERATEDRTALTPGLLLEDALVFGLRMNEGVDLTALRTNHPQAPWAAVDQLAERLAAEGLATLSEGRLALTLRGRLIADAIGTEIMSAMETDLPA